MELAALEKSLAYRFRDMTILEEACRHSSYVNEQSLPGMRNNERLEFLGDAVLNLVVGHLLMQRFQDLPEGNLSRMRAGLVNEIQLAELAKKLHLGDYLLLGKGELQTHGRDKESILADTFEAVIAAIYLDGGFHAAFKFISAHFSKQIQSAEPPVLSFDYKSKLQEIVQETHKITPVYKVIEESGPDHDKTFVVQIQIDNVKAKGVGKSKKRAEQDAARSALEMLPDCR